MGEATIRQTVTHQVIQQRSSILYKAPVLHRDIQRSQCHQHLHHTLGAVYAPAGVATILILEEGHGGEGGIDGEFHPLHLSIIGKRLQCHASDVRVGGGLPQKAPTAPLQLAVQNMLDV